MRIALLYVDAGKGHITPAKALSDAFEQLGHTTVVENLLLDTCKAPLVNWISKHNWRLMLHIPRLEKIIDAKTDSPFNAQLIRFFSTHSHASKDFKTWFDHNRPDCIVVAHFLAANLIKPIVDKLQLDVPVFEYAADVFFTPNAGINSNLDKLYICTEIGKKLSIEQGQSEDTITICPFPLKQSMMHFKPLSKQEARKKLGLKDQFTVLLNLGGEGIGKTDILEEMVKRNLPWQVVTVGSLSKTTELLYQQFRDNHPDFSLISPGFVDNIQDYICACDVQAGKAGANALMESLYLRRPFLVSNLLYAAWPTKDFMEIHQVGWVENSSKKQVDILQHFCEDKQAQQDMELQFDALPLSFDSDALASMMIRDAQAYYDELSSRKILG